MLFLARSFRGVALPNSRSISSLPLKSLPRALCALSKVLRGLCGGGLDYAERNEHVALESIPEEERVAARERLKGVGGRDVQKLLGCERDLRPNELAQALRMYIEDAILARWAYPLVYAFLAASFRIAAHVWPRALARGTYGRPFGPVVMFCLGLR